MWQACKRNRILKDPFPEEKQCKKDNQYWENVLPHSTSNVLVKGKL